MRVDCIHLSRFPNDVKDQVLVVSWRDISATLIWILTSVILRLICLLLHVGFAHNLSRWLSRLSTTNRAGTRVWKAAIVALQYLLDEHGPLKQEYLAKSSTFSCLELGCGLGVPGMILHAFYPDSRIVLTDCAALLPQLESNLKQNFPSTTDIAAKPSLSAATLDWDEAADLQQLLSGCNLDSFDVVLNCDCIYEPLYGTSWKALLQVQVALLQRQPNALVLTSLERRKFDGADKYLAALRQHEAVTKVELVHQDDPVEIYRIYGV